MAVRLRGRSLPGRSVRAKLSTAFLVLVTLGALHIGIAEWGAWRRRLAVQDLHGAVVRQRILLQVNATLDEFQERIGVAEVLDAEAPAVADELKASLADRRSRLAMALDSAASSADDERRAELHRLAADVDALIGAWATFYELRRVQPTAALIVMARDAEPLAHRLLSNDLDAALLAEERAVQQAESTFARVDRTAGRIMWGIFFASAVIAAALAILLIADLLPRLAALKSGVERLRAGDLHHRIQLSGDDELSDVAGSFNEMAETLHVARAELEASNHQLASAVTRLEASRAELVQAEKLKALGGMLAGLAHELNNPLASVLGYGELIQAGTGEGKQLEPEQLGELLSPLLSEAFRAREIVRNMLQFSRASVSALQPVHIRSALKVATALRSYAFSQAGFQLQADVPADLWAVAEPQKLQQVFLNLINNAYDALSEAQGTTLRIHGRQLPDGDVEVRFDDDGPGLKHPERVFDPFYTTKPVGRGTGLGLTLVHRFQEEFGGSVSVHNREGGGATITLRLRGATPPVEAQADGETAEAKAESREAPAHNGTGPRPRLLIVEDELPLLNLQARMVARLGYDTLLADSGAAARDIIRTEHVDAVISDVKMPGEMNGAQLHAWIQEHRPELCERFLFVTGDVHDPALREMLRSEPDRFVTKPFVMDEYLRRVRALVTKRDLAGVG